MEKDKPKRYKVYGLAARLQELRRMINRPDLLSDRAIDMAYVILLDDILYKQNA